jgi:hypothetical protein
MKLALFIPEKLGLVDEVEEDDITAIQPEVVNNAHLPRRGRYELYAFDGRPDQYDIVIEPVTGSGEVEVIPANTPVSGQTIQVEKVVLPDHLTPPGESAPCLAYIVRVSEPGSYLVAATGHTPSASQQNLTLVRSVANQNAFVAIIGGLVQVSLIVLILWLIYRFLNRGKLRDRQLDRQRKAKQWQTVFSTTDADEGEGSEG